MTYAKVLNGAVDSYISSLPQVHTFVDGSNTGNFDLMESSVHRSEGFYIVEDIIPVFNADYEEVVLASTDIQADKVVRTYTKQYRDIADLKAEKLDAIEQLRQAKLKRGTFTVGAPVNDTFIFRNNGEGQTTIDVMKVKMGADSGLIDLSTFPWTNADGDDVVIGVLGFPVFMAAAATYEATVDGMAKYKRAEVKALTAHEDVAAYDVEAGW